MTTSHQWEWEHSPNKWDFVPNQVCSSIFCIFPLGRKLMTLLQCEQKYLNTHHVSPLSTRLGPTRSSKSQTISSLKQLRQNWLCHVLKPPSHSNVTRTDIFNGDDVCDDICDSRGWDIVQEPVSIISESGRAVAAGRMMLTGPEKHTGRESYSITTDYSSPYSLCLVFSLMDFCTLLSSQRHKINRQIKIILSK